MTSAEKFPNQIDNEGIEISSFVFHKDYARAFVGLPLEARGKLITAILVWQGLCDETNAPELDPLTEFALNMLIPSMERLRAKYITTCKNRAKSGRKGAEAKWQKQAQAQKANNLGILPQEQKTKISELANANERWQEMARDGICHHLPDFAKNAHDHDHDHIHDHGDYHDHIHNHDHDHLSQQVVSSDRVCVGDVTESNLNIYSQVTEYPSNGNYDTLNSNININISSNPPLDPPTGQGEKVAEATKSEVQEAEAPMAEAVELVAEQPAPEAKKGTKKSKEFPRAEDFATWWALYPRKVAKENARRAWAKLCAEGVLPELAELTKSLEWQKEGWTNPKYTPHPATYLNARRWEDEMPDPAQFKRDLPIDKQGARIIKSRDNAQKLLEHYYEEESITVTVTPVEPEIAALPA